MRASGTDILFHCPGSAQMQEGLEDEDSAESREGDLLHAHMAHPEMERRLLSPQQQDLLRIADRSRERVIETIGARGEFEEAREQYIESDLVTGHIDYWRAYTLGLEIVTEYKFGWVPVEKADLNLQLRSYAVLRMNAASMVYVAIVQPRLRYEERITMACYHRPDLLAAHDQLKLIKQLSEQPNAPLHAGEWCRYCRAKIICKTYQAAAEKGLIPLAGLTSDVSKAKRLEMIEARLAKCTDQQLARMLESYALIQFAYDPMMDEARRRLEKGGLEGYKLGKPIERRKIVDNKKALSLLVLAGLDRPTLLDNCVTVSITKLEELLRKGLPNELVVEGAKDAKDFVNKKLGSVIEIETGKPRVMKAQ